MKGAAAAPKALRKGTLEEPEMKFTNCQLSNESNRSKNMYPWTKELGTMRISRLLFLVSHTSIHNFNQVYKEHTR